MKRALIVFGGWEGHAPKPISEVFSKILVGEEFDVELSDTLEIFSDLQKLSETDLIVPVWTMGKIDDALVKNICGAVASGTGLAGCHGGMCDAFRESTDWQFMTGSQWVAHPGNDGVEYTVNILKSASSPITEGIDDFKVKSEQYYLHVDPAINVLATTNCPIADGPYAANGAVAMPVVYTKRWGKGRVFYNSLGHSAGIFDIPEAHELMRRGFLWAAK
jgi:type 1 glutamine amidotransferase